ncbi:MAG: Lrp/AsnC family transcriptional regulator [Nitrososphaeraceae archaeon]|nr:Lrp/AsnC family transcriptional regulator [Nitrososphaeraceae archaeon]
MRRRVKNLCDNKAIKKFTIEISQDEKTSAITLISVASTSDTSTVTSRLLKLEGIEVVYEITGQYDIAAIISAPAISQINSYIDEVRKIEGVSDTNTVIILKTMK